MPDLTITTWNINSVRARTERLLSWLERHGPDVLCLQELKCVDAQFPTAEVEALGYRALVHGQPTYNGVAILTRLPFEPAAVGLPGDDTDVQARLVAADVAGIRVVSVYVPNGKEVASDKYAYKLAWLARLEAWLTSQLAGDRPLLVCGDWNIAPDERDANFPDQWAGSVLCHEAVRDAWQRLLGLGLEDLVRRHHDGPGPFTWWDYRALGFPRNDGLRIDHHLASAGVAARCTAASVDRDERKGEKPSDHVPVTVTIAS